MAVDAVRKRATVKLVPRIDLQGLAKKFAVDVNKFSSIFFPLSIYHSIISTIQVHSCISLKYSVLVGASVNRVKFKGFMLCCSLF